VLYTGDGNNGRSITGVGFTPDLVWIKDRSNARWHSLFDSIREPGYRLFSNDTQGDNFSSTSLTSFDNDGFSLGSLLTNNGSAETYVAWCWKAGGAAVSNIDGTITSQVSVNQAAGFSIVSYTGNGSNSQTVGHSLGKTPSLLILKDRDSNSISNRWTIFHSSLLSSNLEFTTDAAFGFQSRGSITARNSSTFTLYGSTDALTVNENGDKYIAYCWTEIEGFSKFGSYVANDDPDGPFVYCGFKPAWVLVKNTSSSSTNWELIDSVRSSNGNNDYLIPNDPLQEYSTEAMDLLSNGFKLRTTSAGWNSASGNTYIFAAFAEAPMNNLYGAQSNAR
jgi:hypothetical protein